MRENPKTQDSTCDLPWLALFYPKSNMILWSIRTFWYKGSAENKKRSQVHEKAYISRKQQPKTQSMISQRSQKNDGFDIWQMGLECHTRYESNPIYQIR